MPLHDLAPANTLDGWLTDGATWTYVSATTFTVTGDQTALFSRGTRLKCFNSSLKYFVVASSSFGAPTTTVTITGGSDYTLANAAISANYYSYAINPQAYPGWFTYTPTWGGFSAAPTLGTVRFSVSGNLCTLLHQPVAGTSNATTFTFTLPVAAFLTGNYQPARVTNNSVTAAAFGMIETTASSATANVYRDGTGLAWTASGSKNATFTMMYEV